MRHYLIGLTNGEEAGLVSEMGSGTPITDVPVAGEHYLYGRKLYGGGQFMKRSDGEARQFTTVASGTGALIQHKEVAFAGGVASVAVTFPKAFAAPPTVVVSIEKTSAPIQTGGTDTITAAGFTFRRSSAAGAVVGHYIAMGAG